MVNNPVDLISLGLYIGNAPSTAGAFAIGRYNPASIIENNTQLPQTLRDRIRRIGENFCVTSKLLTQ